MKSTFCFILVLLALCLMVVPGKANSTREECAMKIQLTMGNIHLTATLVDTEVSREFFSMLPLTLTMEDYSKTEKISYLPRKLPVDTAPAGYDPSVGDITYYAPWGNMAIFYRDFGYAKGLVNLGQIDEGIEKLGAMKGDFEVLFEHLE